MYPKNLLVEIKRYLTSEKNKLEERLSSLVSQDPFSDPDRLNDNAASDTEAKEESSHERMEALEKELKLNLAEVNEALKRIQQGSYGKCVSCSSMIDTDRLAIRPTALFCVSCERKNEPPNRL